MKKDSIKNVQVQVPTDGLKQLVTRNRFPVGHPKYAGAGRVPGSTNRRTKQALEICETLNFHPAAFLATIALTGLMPNPDGSTISVTTEDRLKAATALCPFVMPRLLASQVTTTDDPVERAIDISPLLNDPHLVDIAQQLALAMVDANTADTPAPPAPQDAPPADPAPAQDFAKDLETNSRGHWVTKA
jgi:hypothetical protein